jgi:hypothetical protein
MLCYRCVLFSSVYAKKAKCTKKAAPPANPAKTDGRKNLKSQDPCRPPLLRFGGHVAGTTEKKEGSDYSKRASKMKCIFLLFSAGFRWKRAQFSVHGAHHAGHGPGETGGGAGQARGPAPTLMATR